MWDEAIECFSQVIQINDASNSDVLLPHEAFESTFEQWFLVALIYTFCAVRAHLFTFCTNSGNFELGHQVLKEGLLIVQAHSDSENLLSVACKSYIHTYTYLYTGFVCR